MQTGAIEKKKNPSRYEIKILILVSRNIQKSPISFGFDADYFL